MASILDLVISIYSFGLVAYILLSWMQNVQTEKIRVWLGQFYEPVLKKIRTKLKPVQMGGALLDLAPGVLLAGLYVLKHLLFSMMPKGL